MIHSRSQPFAHDVLSVALTQGNQGLMLRVEDERGNMTTNLLSEILTPALAYRLLGETLRHAASEMRV